MIPAIPEWRAVFFLGGERILSRLVAFWSEGYPSSFGLVAADDGNLMPAHLLPGFVGYASPDDDPKQIVDEVFKTKGETP